MNRTNGCFGTLLSDRLCLETLEDRYLLSGAVVAGALAMKPLSLGSAAIVHAREAANVLLGNGDGSFRSTAQLVAPAGGAPVAVADFNRDGIPDLAVVDHGGHAVSVLLGTHDGSFKVTSTIQTAGTARSLSVGDFNRDGIPDLEVSESLKKPPHGKEQHLTDRNLDPSVTDPTQPKRVVAMDQVAFRASHESAAQTTYLAAVETKPSTEHTKGDNHPTITGQAEEMLWSPGPPLSDDSVKAALHEPCDDVPADRDGAPVSPAGQLLAGLLPIDLTSLERKVDAFFRQMENLAEEAPEAVTSAPLMPWLTAGAVLTAAYALARRRFNRPGPNSGMALDGQGNLEWSGFSGEGVLLPWERS
jgi:hypothetical protein